MTRWIARRVCDSPRRFLAIVLCERRSIKKKQRVWRTVSYKGSQMCHVYQGASTKKASDTELVEDLNQANHILQDYIVTKRSKIKRY